MSVSTGPTDVIRVGCCGFPRRLEEYARHLDAVEVQQTFYRLPRVQTVERWRARVPPSFTFTLKAWQLVTHPPTSPTYRRLGRAIPEARWDRYGFFAPSDEVAEAWAQTLAVARALRAPVVLVQCPASFTATRTHVARLRRFFRTAPRDGLAIAWEPRGDWPPALVARLCRELGLIHCVDPLVDASRHGRPYYFRLHGRTGYRYRHTDDDLAIVAAACRGPAYVFFNNIAMWDDALRFRRLVVGASGVPRGARRR
ncbi:MAG: DUF72 domain-containing protein [Firmicutes bacterium]|mgnify:CR=1 FL=1|nr:DUF72 domain-containing protein [Bacillota bacterium]